MNLNQPYALDMGVLSTGQTALIEVNDAWAIGLYGKAMEAKSYLYFLRSRWREIFLKNMDIIPATVKKP